jgi:hypothetical protein
MGSLEGPIIRKTNPSAVAGLLPLLLLFLGVNIIVCKGMKGVRYVLYRLSVVGRRTHLDTLDAGVSFQCLHRAPS